MTESEIDINEKRSSHHLNWSHLRLSIYPGPNNSSSLDWFCNLSCHKVVYHLPRLI